jgi:hypothetical protein
MLNDESLRQARVNGLISDFRAAKEDLPSAQCAADRFRLRYSVSDIVSFGEPWAQKGKIASAGALCRSFLAADVTRTQDHQLISPPG